MPLYYFQKTDGAACVRRVMCFLRALAVLALASWLGGAALAQPELALSGPARRVLEDFLSTQTTGLPGEVSVQAINPPTGPLPACSQGALEAFLPAGTRAWGRVQVGIRCTGNPLWTRYVPTHVAVRGGYYVATRAISAGQLMGSLDAELRQGDLTALPTSVVTDLAQWQGAQALNAMAPDTPIRRELLRSLPLVQPGQNVTVRLRGQGFVISTEGRALTAAAVGAKLQVKLASGQQITGVLGADGQVERLN